MTFWQRVDFLIKGQLISKFLIDVSKFSKEPTKSLTNFCPSAFTLFIWPLFYCFLHSSSRAEICQIFRCFFGKFKKSKRHSEINWPLVLVQFWDCFEIWSEIHEIIVTYICNVTILAAARWTLKTRNFLPWIKLFQIWFIFSFN